MKNYVNEQKYLQTDLLQTRKALFKARVFGIV